jgi:uncharacterized protein YciI
MPYFALTMVCGPSWDPARPRREQDGWDEHAAFMDRLADEGFVILGGPVGDGTEVLLAVVAADEKEIRARLGEDPWAPKGLLEIGTIQPWSVWLSGRYGGRKG